MNGQIKIREAIKSDLEDLARLNSLFNTSNDTAAQLEKRLANPYCAEIPIVAEIENKIVGFAALRVVPYLFYPGSHAEVTELFVEAGFRRQGVGQALLAYVETLAYARDAEELILHTDQGNQTG